MQHDEDVKSILIEIRDNQRESLRRQQEHLDIANQQLERATTQINESIGLQKEAVAKARAIGRIAFPAILVCLALILYLVVRYF